MYYVDNVKHSSEIEGAVIISLDTFDDVRGKIWTLYGENSFLPEFVEDKITISYKNVLRGLHGDALTGKLITCIGGAFQLAIADMRRKSPTYTNTYMITLNDEKPTSIYIPPGCINGHLCLSDKCTFHYKWTRPYEGIQDQVTILWNDPDLAFECLIQDPILSERDQNGTSFKRSCI